MLSCKDAPRRDRRSDQEDRPTHPPGRRARRRLPSGAHLAVEDVGPRLDEIPGIGMPRPDAIVAEIGFDMAQFPTAGHLVSWAKVRLARSSPDPEPIRSNGQGKPLPEAGPRRGRGFGSKDRHVLRREVSPPRATPRQQRALVAVSRSILVVVWHLLDDPNARFVDLGSDYYDARQQGTQNERPRPTTPQPRLPGDTHQRRPEHRDSVPAGLRPAPRSSHAQVPALLTRYFPIRTIWRSGPNPLVKVGTPTSAQVTSD